MDRGREGGGGGWNPVADHICAAASVLIVGRLDGGTVRGELLQVPAMGGAALQLTPDFAHQYALFSLKYLI